MKSLFSKADRDTDADRREPAAKQPERQERRRWLNLDGRREVYYQLKSKL